MTRSKILGQPTNRLLKTLNQVKNTTALVTGITGQDGAYLAQFLLCHESPLRGREFVTRKITDSVAKITLGKLDCLSLGNIDAQRDWGYAKDYVEGMWKMLQIDEPDTFVLATNRTESVRTFVELAFAAVDIDITWTGSQENDSKYYRPAEVEILIGNPEKAAQKLNWFPKTSLENLCTMMVKEDLVRNERGLSF